MIESRTKEINGSVYTVNQMPARAALRMKARLVRLFGPSLAQLFISDDSNLTTGISFSKDDIVKALMNLSAELNEKEFDKLCVDLLKDYVLKDDIMLNEREIDIGFAGDLLTLFQVIWFVLEVNYGTFFGGGGIGNLLENNNPPKKSTT